MFMIYSYTVTVEQKGCNRVFDDNFEMILLIFLFKHIFGCIIESLRQLHTSILERPR